MTKITFFASLTSALVLLLLSAGTALALWDVGNYKLLEPTAISLRGDVTEVSSFAEWAGYFLKTVLGLIAGIAVIQLAYGGIEYILSASLAGKSDGRDRITNALTGLGIALTAWLILYLVNPDLVIFPGFLQ